MSHKNVSNRRDSPPSAAPDALPSLPATARGLPDSSQNSPIAPETASEISFEVLRFHLNPRPTEGTANTTRP